jgi:hypothetical protein
LDIVLVYVAALLGVAGIVVAVGTIRIPHLARRLRRPALKALAAAALLTSVVALWPTRLHQVHTPLSHLDALMPEYQFRETHSIRIHSTPLAIESMARGTCGEDIPGFRLMRRIQILGDQIGMIRRGPIVPGYNREWICSSAGPRGFLLGSDGFLIDPRRQEWYHPADGPSTLELFARDTTGDSASRTAPPVESSATLGRRILDAYADDFGRAGCVLVARVDTLETFRIGPPTGSEIWVEVRIQSGGRAFLVTKHWTNDCDPVREWPVLEWLQLWGFDRLAYERHREFVIGRLQRVVPHGATGAGPRARDAAHFVAFDEPGYVKSAIAFSLTPLGNGWYRLTVERRVLALDRHAARAYTPLWRLSRPGRDAFHIVWLRAMRNRAMAWNPHCSHEGFQTFPQPDSLP